MNSITPTEGLTKQIRRLFFLLGFIFPILFMPGRALAQSTYPESYDSDVFEPNNNTPASIRSDPYFSKSSLESTGDNLYGYTISVIEKFEWIPITDSPDTNTELSKIGAAGPFQLGFQMPFFENVYTEVYISTSGLITFGAANSDPSNMDIPYIGLPHNFIAPFWDDLYVDDDPEGKVLYQSLTGKFVVEWRDVNVIGGGSQFTFQAVLYENGDICFQYKSMIGDLKSATVGIEDPDGVDGVRYIYNAAGIENLVGEKQVCFNRPPKSYRVKVLPYYQGGMAYQNSSQGVSTAEYEISISNIGDSGNDNFSLSLTSLNKDWSAVITDENGKQISTTGILAPGAAKTIRVFVKSPPNAPVGSWNTLTVTVVSMNDPGIKREVQIQTTVPAKFAQALYDSRSGMDLSLIWRYEQRTVHIADKYTGSTIAVAVSPVTGDYIYVWERNLKKLNNKDTYNYTDVEYSLINKFGIVTTGSSKLTDNYAETTGNYQYFDREPVVTVGPSGKAGLAWVRWIYRVDTDPEGTVSYSYNTNVYFSIFDPARPGTIREIKLTDNNEYHSSDNNAPLYYSPQIAVSKTGDFAVVWETRNYDDSGLTKDISLAIYSQTGALKFIDITESVSGVNSFQNPVVDAVFGNRFLIAYSRYEHESEQKQANYQIIATVYDANGNLFKPAYEISGAHGQLPDVHILDNNTALIAWTQLPESQIQYSILNDKFVAGPPIPLSTPDGRLADKVSIAVDDEYHGILTWQDVDLSNQLYYASTDSNGVLITKPIPFITLGPFDSIIINDSGCSLASYIGSFLINLPLIMR